MTARCVFTIASLAMLGAAPLSQQTKVSTVSASGVLGRTVTGPDGQEIGRIVDVLVDAASSPRAAVIDFGGFLGIGNRRVAVDWSEMRFPPTGSTADIGLRLSLDQIRNAPAYTDQTKPAPVVAPVVAPLPAKPSSAKPSSAKPSSAKLGAPTGQ